MYYVNIDNEIFYTRVKMLTLEQIRAALYDRRVDVVAQATGLHYNTVFKVRSGENENPTYRVIKALSDYFEATRDGR